MRPHGVGPPSGGGPTGWVRGLLGRDVPGWDETGSTHPRSLVQPWRGAPPASVVINAAFPIGGRRRLRLFRGYPGLRGVRRDRRVGVGLAVAGTAALPRAAVHGGAALRTSTGDAVVVVTALRASVVALACRIHGRRRASRQCDRYDRGREPCPTSHPDQHTRERSDPLARSLDAAREAESYGVHAEVG